MPLYGYKCACGREFEKVLPLARYDEEMKCECGQIAKKLIFAPLISADLPGYESPIDGRWIEGRAARREDLARNHCRPYEAGEKQEFERRRAYEEALFEKQVGETVEREFESMPGRKKERLAAELEGGMTLEVNRG